MRQVGVVSWLAMRELWVSFRLLVLLGAFVAAGAFVAIVPDAPAVLRERFSLGLGLAVGLAAAVAAWSMARERELGRAGWLVSRAVRRRTLLAGWFIALGATTLIGLVAAGGLGWAAVSSVSRPPDGLTFGLHLAAIGCGALAATALGLLVGALVPFRPAIVLALVLCAALGAGVVLVPGMDAVLPGGAHLALADPDQAARPVAEGLRASGLGLLATATLLLLARLALERAEL